MSTIFGVTGAGGAVRTAEGVGFAGTAGDAGPVEAAGAASRTSDSGETDQSKVRHMSQTGVRTSTRDLYFLGIRAIVKAR
ncbi:MAG: hypothetical protein OXI19_08770 [Gemmatimonadota bacterium]|nr:hypothetical protein [Gemmatimonadota bacterium]